MFELIRWKQLWCIGLALLLAGCAPQPLPRWNEGKLIVVVNESQQGIEAEFEKDLIKLFSEQIHSQVEVIATSPDKVYAALLRGKAHLAAASLRSDARYTHIQFAPSYQESNEVVVCHPNYTIQSEKDFAAVIPHVIAGSSQEYALKDIQAQDATVQWYPRKQMNAQQLLNEVAQGVVRCAVTSTLQFTEAHHYHPNLVSVFELKPSSKLAWAFPSNADPQLMEQARIFFNRIEHNGTLRQLYDRYYGFAKRLATDDSEAFIQRTKEILPKYRLLFKVAALSINEDWRLLAALSYQESQWDPLATSFANVRGMMMLTEETAQYMNVHNRLDARESVLAGAKYFAQLKQKLSSHIKEPDRTWLAMAAYNQGFAHLEDARILTKRAGLNPDSWVDVKRWMPQLSNSTYASTVKYGHARGGEAVIMVESIRSYYKMLMRLEPDPVIDARPALSPLKSRARLKVRNKS